MKVRRGLPVVLVIVIVAVLGISAWQSGWFSRLTADASAPGSPTSSTTTPANGPPAAARTQLDELAIKSRGPMAGYSREKYPHWIMISGECNTRETVLTRDGQDVRTDAQCRAVSGRWNSPYDGATWTHPSDVDIDHVVPLAQSWVSGASGWTTERRREFANDVIRPQLKVVTDNVNQAKSDKAPDQWRPPLQTEWCVYATNWIEVKHHYQLSITGEEKVALLDMLGHC
nr:HNH endonuclease family protein [Kibdelosporangium sp. MJ126-NF4]